ncbi:TPR repeat [Olavius algarvensis associated proteobacterium Delta 3]|nr:TPR repeat [Olavius algarvensis associated proteobacterium Delta 3]
MRTIYTYGLFLVLFTFVVAPLLGPEYRLSVPSAEATEQLNDSYGDRLGTVRFPLSCSDAANQLVERGGALLHHMTYNGARASFAAATQQDPECAMGYWGQAMTYIHPLWSDKPSRGDFETGRALVAEARARGQKTDRENAYIAAVSSYYEAGWTKDEAANLRNFEAGWENAYRRFPEDIEAASFYALAHLATASPGDKIYQKQKKAGAIAETILVQVSDHPGAHHYAIHAYDYPLLAYKALNIANNYGEIAPDIPHALHMPTHIFTRVGLWDESIIFNKRSAEAALKHPAGNKISLHYPHALDYLVYAYLQQADDDSAKQVMDELLILEGSFQTHIAASYSFTAIPARYALERQQWADAAALDPGLPANYPIGKFPAMEAITYFARALGAARSGNVAMAKQAYEKLVALQGKAEKTSAYWANQIEIQRLSAKAWITYQEGREKEALGVMQQAAELESLTEKHPVTPGEILPARELLADMLLAMGRYKDAQAEYESVLRRSANRFNSLYGAGVAAEMVKNKEEAVWYFKKLMETTGNVETDRKQVQHAKLYLTRNQMTSGGNTYRSAEDMGS